VLSDTECQKKCKDEGCSAWSFDPAGTCDLIREQDLKRALKYKNGGSVRTRKYEIEGSVGTPKCKVSNAFFETSAATGDSVLSDTECQEKCAGEGCSAWGFDPDTKKCDLIKKEDPDRAVVYKEGGSYGIGNCSTNGSKCTSSCGKGGKLYTWCWTDEYVIGDKGPYYWDWCTRCDVTSMTAFLKAQTDKLSEVNAGSDCDDATSCEATCNDARYITGTVTYKCPLSGVGDPVVDGADCTLKGPTTTTTTTTISTTSATSTTEIV
jgi:hypothetical protein